MKASLQDKMQVYRHKNRIRKRILIILVMLAVCTFFLVDKMMMITAVGQDKNPEISADQVMMITGGSLKAHISAEADGDKEETVFVIRSVETGASISGSHQFINEVTDITDDEGKVIKLYREKTEKEDIVLYTFSLAKGNRTEFDLYFSEIIPEEETAEEASEKNADGQEEPKKQPEESLKAPSEKDVIPSEEDVEAPVEETAEEFVEVPDDTPVEETAEELVEVPDEATGGEYAEELVPEPAEVPAEETATLNYEIAAEYTEEPAALNYETPAEYAEEPDAVSFGASEESEMPSGEPIYETETLAAMLTEVPEEVHEGEPSEVLPGDIADAAEEEFIEKGTEPAEEALIEEGIEPAKEAPIEEGVEPAKEALIEEGVEPAKEALIEEVSDPAEESPVKEAAEESPVKKAAEPAEESLTEDESVPEITAEVVLTSGSGNSVKNALDKADRDIEPLILQWAREGLEDQVQFLTATVYSDGTCRERLRESGTRITVHGKMPVGVVARAYPLELTEDYFGDEAEEFEILCVYDISLYTALGDEWQPEQGSVEVSIHTASMKKEAAKEEVNDVKVYHITDEGTAENVRLTDGMEGMEADRGVAFKAKSFSPYAVLLLLDPPSANEVYLSGKGSDENTGLTPEEPVKTFDKAKEILGDTEGTIYIVSTVDVTGSETWELAGGQTVMRAPAEGETVFNGSMVHIREGGELKLRNITLDGGSEDPSRETDETKAKGPILLSTEGSSVALQDGTILLNNDNTNTAAENAAYTCHGGAIAVYGGTVTIDNAEIRNCRAAFGGGIFIGRSGSVTMNSGTIEECDAAIIDGEPVIPALPAVTHDSGAGGGVALAVKTSLEEEMLAQGETAQFIMNGGTIRKCTAYTGGAVSAGSYNFYESSFYADHSLTVNGGLFEENTAESTGGAFFIGAGATGHFTGHSRTDIRNNSVTAGDQNSGGGIYIDGECGLLGKVYMDNVVITGNTSSSFGGGISACPSGDTNVLLERGGAIFGNTAAGNAASDDVFIDRSGVNYLVDTMLGGGSHNWAFTYSQDLLGKANPTGEDTAAAEHIAHIFITGNTVVGSDAEKGRGGGIGNNGLLEIGEKEPHSFALKKVDEETGADLSGAIFLLEGTTVSGKELKAEKITEASGYAEFTNLPFGTYTLTEKEAPKDYELSDRVLTLNVHAGSGVTLTENGETLPLVNGEFGWEYSFTNKAEEELTGLKIELYKTDYSQTALEGAEFELYSAAASESERALIGKKITDKDGLASWKGLEAGDYILIESEAPEGYLKYENEIELILAEDGTLTFTGEVKDDAAVISNTAKGRVNVRNESEAYTLPATGGPGTTIFIMAGLMLMAAAGSLIYRKQRKQKH